MSSNDYLLSADCQKELSKQVNAELRASYLYLAMAQYFGNEKVALPGFNKFFQKASKEEREHAIMVSSGCLVSSFLSLCNTSTNGEVKSTIWI